MLFFGQILLRKKIRNKTGLFGTPNKVGVSPAIPFAAFSAKINDDEHQKKPRFHKKNTKIFEAIEYFNYKETLTNYNPDIVNIFGLFILKRDS
jgi:hypothetical protein